jgi:hypothetical protein
MTAIPKAILRAMTARDGHRSAWTGADVDTLVPQDRGNRGMGGRSVYDLANYVWLESDINGLIESDATWAAEARERGIKISRFADPRLEPIKHAVHGDVFLDNQGGITPADDIPKF